MKRIISILEIRFNLFVLKKMLLSSFHVLLPSLLSMEGWRILGFYILFILGSLLVVFNIDIIYYSFSLLFQDGESKVYVLNTVPVITYLDVISDRDKILKDNRGKSGIYRWTNVNNKKAWEAQSGRAELWRCLGYKFKSYVRQ
jgi:hypothetical protein